MSPPSVMPAVLGLSPLLLAGSALGWTPLSYPAGCCNLTVDAQSRNDVVAFWHGVYQASEGYQDRHGWTGNYTAGPPYDSGVGTTSAVFVADTQRRINFFRALCGVPANVRLNTGATVRIDAADSYKPAAATTKQAAAERSAYMLTRTWGYFDGAYHPPNGDLWAALNHNPAEAECVAWTTAAWNANFRGDLAIGYYGPGAVDSYMAEEVTNGSTSSWNTTVGHRRWLLYPASTDMATGDTPGAFDSATNAIRLPTNVIYVVPKGTEVAAVPPGFTSFPPAGYFPAPLNGRFWSLAYPGADFSVATVTMTTGGGSPVTANVVARNGGFGDPALVWQVGPEALVKSVTADRTFKVTVAGITGTGVPSSRSYAVTLINPGQITSDQSVFGPSVHLLTTAVGYQITPPDHAEAIQVNSFRALSTPWTEGAEDNPAPQVTASTTDTYLFRSNESYAANPGYWTAFGPLSGSKSFRLTIPCYNDQRLNGAPTQAFELNKEILPGSLARLNFRYRRGLMESGVKLAVESSGDAGLTWSRLGSEIVGNGYPDPSPTSDFRDLPPSTTPVRIRFRLSLTPGEGTYTSDRYPALPTGILIDDITTTNCKWLELMKTNELAVGTTGFTLNGATAGIVLTNNLELRLRMRTKLGNHWMPYGPMKTVTLGAATLATTPVFSPGPGAHSPGQVITIAGESNSLIRYRVNGGAEQSAASPFTGLTTPAHPATLSITAYSAKAGLSDSPLASASYSSNVFGSWAAEYFPGVSDPLVVGGAADPDGDGQANILEFALGGDPSTAGATAVIQPLTSDDTPVGKLLVTLAVRAGTPAFTGSPSPSATHDGLTYTILGGFTLTQTDAPVSVAAPREGDLPAAPAGYEYRTFKLDSSDGLAGKGFMRVKISANP